MGLKNRASGKIYNLKIIDQKYPEIQLIQRDKKGEWEVSETEKGYSGVLQSAKISTFQYKGDTKHKLNLDFLDPDTGEKETLGMNFNSIALNIINILANEDTLFNRKIDITLYSKKDDKGEDRPKIYIEIDGEKGSWKFDASVVSKIYQYPEKWVDLFDKFIAPKLENPIDNEPSNEEEDFFTDKDDTKESKDDPEVEDFDDLPF